MQRRTFIHTTGLAATGLLVPLPSQAATLFRRDTARSGSRPRELRADLVIIGGGLGGCAAALAALRHGLQVIMTEETDWIGGQLTQQAVPPDENRWIETHGCTKSYRALRDGIRAYYRQFFPLTPEVSARPQLNPGDGFVSRLCHEPRVALAVLESFLAPYRSSGQLQLLLETHPLAASVEKDRILAVKCRSSLTGHDLWLQAPSFIDATELGDLLPLAGAEHVMGAESRADHQEPHAPAERQPANQQGFTVCFALEHRAGENHTIDKPAEYPFWRDYVPKLRPTWPGRLLSLTYSHPQTLQPRTVSFDPEHEGQADPVNIWRYRRIARKTNFLPGRYQGDISLVNWPQNDYWLGNLVGVSSAEAQRHLRRAKQLSLSLVYWLQHEVPRPDGGTGWPGLRLRGDITGTEDGLAKYPYIRESRRIQSVFTITELHCGRQARAAATGTPEATVRAERYSDSVGIGHYNIDLHPSSLGDNYVDVPSLPFQIPLGALLPVRVSNLLPACKNLGTTHITNGCYRLHPVEWNIGEAAGALVAFARERNVPHRAVRENPMLLSEFQSRLRDQGFELEWPNS